MDKIIRIEEEQFYKDVDIEVDGETVTQQVLDYTLKHTFEDEVLVETMKAYIQDGCVSQIKVFPLPDIELLKKSKISEINIACQNEINSEFTSSVSGEEHSYGYNKDDQFNFMKQSKILDLNPALTQIFWSTRDGIVQLTKEQFNNLLLEAAAHEQSKWSKYFILKAQIDAAETPEVLEVIVW